MINLRKSDERGKADHGWLKSRHTFSFADYHDPAHMGYRTLRVINEDHIEGGKGFGTHPHRDMEIISYVASGALEHKDSMGNSTVILPGEVQRMSAGTGVRHSEFNPNPDREAHLFQIWILPEKAGASPSYGQKSFEQELNKNDLVLVVSKDGRDGSLSMNQDADVYISRLRPGRKLSLQIRPGRGIWAQMINGRAKAQGRTLERGDAISIENDSILLVETEEGAELMIFDLGPA